MDEYISKQSIVLDYSGLAEIGPNDFVGIAKYFADQIFAIPAADVAPVRHGRWEDEFGGKYENPNYRCSICKGRALLVSYRNELLSWTTEQELSEYCPNCGAKMDGEE